MTSIRELAGTWLILSCAISAAWGQAGSSSSTNIDLAAAPTDSAAVPAQPENARDPFAKGSWTFQTYGSAAFGDSDKGKMYAGHIGFGYHLLDNFSINLEGLGASIDAQRDDDGAAGGVDLLFRWHWLRHERWSLYAEGGAGVQEATTNFPSDYHFNFRLEVGVGATYRLCPSAYLMGGARYLHISNANISEINDGFDSVMMYVGVLVPF